MNRLFASLLICFFLLLPASLHAYRQAAGSKDIVTKGAEWAAADLVPAKPIKLQMINLSTDSRSVSTWRARSHGPSGAFKTLWGEGLTLEGDVMQDAQAAAEAALGFWETHTQLLPKGMRIDDLQTWSNVVTGGIRFVSHRQMIDGLPVLGSGVYVAISKGRLVMAGIRCFTPPAQKLSLKIGTTLAEETALNAVRSLDSSVRIRSTEPVVFPLVFPDEIRLVPAQVSTMTGKLGSWTAFIDAGDGQLLALRDKRIYATGKIELEHHNRSPSLGDAVRSPAPYLSLGSNQEGYTDVNGAYTTGDAQADFLLNLQGSYTDIENLAGSDLSVQTGAIAEGQSFVWSSADEFGQAQLDAYRFASDVRIRAGLMVDDLPWLNERLVFNVNEDDTCNAYFDTETGEFTFFRAGTHNSGMTCNNTAMLADVVYHEFGHGFHFNNIIPGVGSFDEAVSEGFSDFMSSSITNDSKMSPGFSTDGGILRDIEPDRSWPDDQDEDPHITGLIVGGALWDLRKIFIAQMGEETGSKVMDRLFGGILKYTSDVPSLYESAILADDDNGNLDDGTPHGCAIEAAFGPHGLVGDGLQGLSIIHEPITHVLEGGQAIAIDATVRPRNPDCWEGEQGAVRLAYSTDAGLSWTRSDMQSVGSDLYQGMLPAMAAGRKLLYRIEVNENSAGRVLTRPENPAAPYYHLYIGELSPIVCDDFETQDAGWTHELISGDNQEGADDWQWGAPAGRGGDPRSASSGTYVWGNDLAPADNWNGQYQPNKVNTLKSPQFDLEGAAFVRLQFKRWLTVEDAMFDKAILYVNEQPVWSNARGEGELHHEDSEWLLFDIDISDQVLDDSTVQLRWELDSDEGLELGGWTLDDICLYEMLDAPVDGDDPTDGDDPVDGDVLPDGDDPTDGDDPADGDDPTDGDDPADGDDPTDGDIPDDIEIPLPDGDFVMDGDTGIDGGGDSDTEDGYQRNAANGVAGGCRHTGSQRSGAWLFLTFILLAVFVRLRKSGRPA